VLYVAWQRFYCFAGTRKKILYKVVQAAFAVDSSASAVSEDAAETIAWLCLVKQYIFGRDRMQIAEAHMHCIISPDVCDDAFKPQQYVFRPRITLKFYWTADIWLLKHSIPN
jgi:hypothetical protein